MAIRSQRVLASFLARGDARRPDARHSATIPIVLDPRPGVAASDKPPVRIFLGTEAAQFRAERVFVRSIERVRDPARCYEIHLMKDLAGFERRLWLTGFTNYRFAIPALAGARGRAIYNDADQIYLRDPACLFDLPMHDKGVLSINDRDTSVMLIDCARMAVLWNSETARTTGNRELERYMREAGLWGDLDAGWNARDAEYDPATSHLVHYTTIHTQPWRPTPYDYVYRDNPAGGLWNEIERDADAAGFQLFGPEQPSPEFSACAARGEIPGGARLADFRRLAADAHAETIGYCGFDDRARIAGLAAAGRAAAVRVESLRPLDLTQRSAPTPAVDIVAADGLAGLPDLDMPWVLDALFARARRAVIVAITLDFGAHRRTPAHAHWWYAQLAAASARCPDRHWRLIVRRDRWLRPATSRRWSGGALLTADPSVWTLLHYKAGHRSQALGISNALGWPYQTREVARAPWHHAVAMLRDGLGVASARLPGNLKSPWPEVVVASGWLPAVLARAIRARNLANTRLILLGRRGGRVGETQDIGLVCRHFDLPPNPREIRTTLPPSKVAEQQLAAARAHWQDLYTRRRSPRVAMLVGGDNVQHRLDATTAQTLTERVCEQVRDRGGQLAILASRRTPTASAEAIRVAADGDAHFEGWNAHPAQHNPYLGYLAHADILVVTGESESMLAEAVATGKPVYIVALPERTPNLRRRVADWVVGQAITDRFNARGSRRPQEGLQYLCARLVERRLFVPRRNMPELHADLIELGVARRFEGCLDAWKPPVWHETDWIAQRIRAWLPVAGAAGNGADPEPAHVARG